MRKLILLLALLASTVQAEVYDIQDFSLGKYKGKVVYLDFWASWCKPCRRSFPWMNGLMQKYPSDQFEVVTINLDQQNKDMYRFLEQVPAQFDVYHDPAGNIAEQFKLEGMPTSYLINRDGKIISKHIGFNENKKQELETEIESLL